MEDILSSAPSPQPSPQPSPETSSDSKPKSGNLVLKPSDNKATVKVSKLKSPPATAGFTSDSDKDTYTGGVEWKFKKGDGNLTITFKLEDGVASLSSAADPNEPQFSSVSDGKQTLEVSPEQATNNFTVTFTTTEHTEDPVVIITPA